MCKFFPLLFKLTVLLLPIRVYVANFLYPMQYGLYAVSVILGVGAACMFSI